ncbi:major facilitator superfamily domain-containing protein [Rhypophila decipiens]|uniref:Major facilitator superfamily domain-containing protein n=1 Tax=Rhypophila decipiens TaxID=261697 RepID=A0AAN6YJ96_9PEZI|nr:major facilitator superfamily domain-containing protein [Rhypophila decipiens]
MEPTSTTQRREPDTRPGVWHRRHTHEHRGATSSSPSSDHFLDTTQSSTSEEEFADTKTPDEDEPSKITTKISEKPLPEPPYHVFTRKEKWALVYIVSLAGLFSPLSSNIYFPALGAIAKALQTNIALVSLTVTIYMVVQGLAPSFWGPLSDTRGRRLTFMGTFTVYLMANIGLAFSKDFTTLMIFRAIQAAGSAATISVGAGVIGDITTPKERGGFVGSFGGIRMLGQSIGPVIGGIITEYFGFHAIFWFLFILGTTALLLILLFLPETLRRIAGNGTIPLEGIYRPVFYSNFKRHWKYGDDTVKEAPPRITPSTIFSPFRFLFEKDVFVTLFFGAIVYTVWSMITSSTTALFQPRYGLGDLQVGLIFLPNGVGCVSGSYLTGKLLDRDYRIVEAAYRASHGLSSEVALDRKKLADFPVSRARLRSSAYLVVPFILAVGGYGFAIDSPALAAKPGMALPLVLQFVIAFTATAVFTQNSALMVDLYPGASASATAVNNLIRCAIGAAGVAAIQFIIDDIGAGVTFLIFAIITLVLSPLLVLEWFYGEEWRKRRMERLEREKAEKRVLEGGELGASGEMSQEK